MERLEPKTSGLEVELDPTNLGWKWSDWNPRPQWSASNPQPHVWIWRLTPQPQVRGEVTRPHNLKLKVERLDPTNSGVGGGGGGCLLFE
ncbi:hypothetical protein P3S68_002633 [Capsicum galapagoense]